MTTPVTGWLTDPSVCLQIKLPFQGGAQRMETSDEDEDDEDEDEDGDNGRPANDAPINYASLNKCAASTSSCCEMMRNSQTHKILASGER